MPHNIFVFVPAFGHQITATTFLSILNLQQRLLQQGMGCGVSAVSFPDIGELRDMALTIWYDSPSLQPTSHMLFVDADMGFEPQVVLDMLMFNEPIVGACYPRRVYPVQWSPSGTGEPQTELRGGFMRVEGVGMGCTLIRRDAIKHMLDVMPDMVDKRISQHPAKGLLEGAGVSRIIRAFDSVDLPGRGKLSEDLSFCIRWAHCGGQIWANVAHRFSHVGQHDFSGCYLEMLQQMQAQQVQQAEQQANLMRLSEQMKQQQEIVDKWNALQQGQQMHAAEAIVVPIERKPIDPPVVEGEFTVIHKEMLPFLNANAEAAE